MAESRRRSTAVTGTGVGLKDIRKHLIANIPGLEDISMDTIHQLLVPPRKKSSRALRYKCLIEVQVPKRKNDHRDENAHQHFPRGGKFFIHVT